MNMAKQPRKPPADKSQSHREVPPGATRRAWDREIEPAGGGPGSGAGPRHAADDWGSEQEEYEAVDATRTPATPRVEDDTLEQGPPFAGRAGGAVGGTPAQKRTKLNVPDAASVPQEPDPVVPRMGPSEMNVIR